MELKPDTQVAYEQHTFEGASYASSDLAHLEFYECTFLRCSFAEATLRDCRFVDCIFQDCDLSLASIPDCTFATTRFRDCQLLGINWTEASWPKRGLLRSVGFQHCALSHSTFLGLDLRGADITDCVAHNVDFAEADLSGVNCSGTDFAQSRFLHTDLTKADFVGAVNYAIAPHLNTLKGTRFSLPEAMSLLYGLDIVLIE